MPLHMNALVGGLTPMSLGEVDKIIARQTWAEYNIHDCQEDCDKLGKIEVQLEEDSKPYRVACPLFNKSCRRGKVFHSAMMKTAEESIPNAIPPRFRKSLARYDNTEAIQGVGEWNGEGVLYVHGLTGTGKSFAAAWWVYNRIKQRLERDWEEPYKWRDAGKFELRWFTAFDICLDRFNMYDARNAPLLIIDDLGCESDTPTNRAIINDVIAFRYSYNTSTIITSNLTPEEMSGRYKDRMYERIIQTGLFVDAGRFNKRLER